MRDVAETQLTGVAEAPGAGLEGGLVVGPLGDDPGLAALDDPGEVVDEPDGAARDSTVDDI